MGGPGKICLQNDRLRVSVLPEAGGKIAELVDLKSGRNWLWSNPDIPFGRNEYGANYGQVLDSGGWDEILMSVKPTQLKLANKAIVVPDHGDVVGQTWAVLQTDEEDDGTAVCKMSVTGRAAKYLMTRTMRLEQDKARLSVNYSLINNESFALPWYWCAHTLLAAEPGMRIELPARQDFRVDEFASDQGRPIRLNGQWPGLSMEKGAALDLSQAFKSKTDGDGFAAKVFVRSPAIGSVSVVIGGTSERLTLQYDSAQLPWLGLWINNNGWSGNGGAPYQNLGLEPATTAYDDVAEALEKDSIDWLQPGETRRWSLAMEVHS